VNEAGFDFFFNHDEKKRMDLRLSYDLKVKTINGTEFTLHHKLTPFRLCKNGNLWLALCHVIEVASKDTKNVNMIDAVDGKKYNFVNGYFVLSKDEVLTYREKQILAMLAKDMTAEQISKNLSISLPVLNRHKRKIFNKLGVEKSTSAIHKAHTEGLI
jgi:DNA-binding CsgD family transcriptional regulator